MAAGGHGVTPPTGFQRVEHGHPGIEVRHLAFQGPPNAPAGVPALVPIQPPRPPAGVFQQPTQNQKGSEDMNPETKEKLSKALKEKWASGTRKPNPKESRDKARQTLKARYASGDLVHRTLPEATRKRCSELFREKYKGRILRKTPIAEWEKEKIKRIGEEFRKTDPRAQKGPKNQAARVWRLRSPVNKIYEFKNLLHFIRENENLFNSEDVVWKTNGRVGKTCKAHGGLSMLSPRRKKAHGVWKGWTWVSHIESIYNDQEDLLSRTHKVLTDTTNQPTKNNT